MTDMANMTDADLRFLGAEGSPTQLLCALVENTKDLSSLVGLAALDCRLHGVELHRWSLEFDVEGHQVAVSIRESGALGDYTAREETRFQVPLNELLHRPQHKGWYIDVEALRRNYTLALRESGDWDRTESACEDFFYTLEVEGKYRSWVREQA